MNAPLIIALGAQIRPEHSISVIGQMMSVGAAETNMLNAFHTLGFGGLLAKGANSYDLQGASALSISCAGSAGRLSVCWSPTR
jgi:hypothetical protein